MESLVSSSDEGIRAQIQLLKAHMQTKSLLLFNISQLKIKNSYRQSNTDFRDFRDVIGLSKLLSKKLSDLKSINNTLRSTEFKLLSSEQTKKLLEIIVSSESSMTEIEKILQETQSTENYISLLKEKHQQLTDTYNLKRRQSRNISDILYQNLDRQKMIEDIQEEIRDYKAEISAFEEENAILQEKRAKKNLIHRKSVDRIKFYHQLSENAMKLRSKLLFKTELKKNIRNAELELEFHELKVKKEEDRIAAIEEEAQENAKCEAKYASDLKTSGRRLERLEARLENLYKEREELMIQDVVEESVENSLKNNEKSEESGTVSLVSLLNGFIEMRKERESLTEENNKLKQRIANLFTVKV